MRPRIASLGLGMIAVLAMAVAPVAAGDGSVTIVSDVNFRTGAEKFTADGAFCPSGSGVTTEQSSSGGGSMVFHVAKAFTCKDGSGSLYIELDAVFNPQQGGTTGGWTVVGGTGDWANASGGGQIEGTPTRKGILDTYTGTINR